MFAFDLNILSEEEKNNNPFLNNCDNRDTHTNTKNTRKQTNKILKNKHKEKMEKEMLLTQTQKKLIFTINSTQNISTQNISTQNISTHNKFKKRD